MNNSTATVCMSASLCLNGSHTWQLTEVCQVLRGECVCVCVRNGNRTRRSQLRRLVLLSHRQPVKAFTGWKVAGIRWSPRLCWLAGLQEKGYKEGCSQRPFKKPRDYLQQCNGTMGLHQPVVRGGRACLQGVGSPSRYCHSGFFLHACLPSSITD